MGNDRIYCARADNTKFEDNFFDIVSSQYTLQGIYDIGLVYREVARILKLGGRFVFLATHPMRQYFEKKDAKADCFKPELVDSVILNATITVQEPTHTFNEYFSEYFLSHFIVNRFIELQDPTAEKVGDRIYPGFFIVDCI